MSMRARAGLVIAFCVLASMPDATAGSDCPTTRFNLLNHGNVDILAINTPPGDHNWLSDALGSSAKLHPKVGVELNIAWPQSMQGGQCVCTVTLRIIWAGGNPADIKDDFCRRFRALIVTPKAHKFEP